ncbi:unnamed protein product [Parnassius apollo]|uniref:(apollo) hypothetical protein n=1 Tax=Parnassius apollo TaxID=110799 RepID=A0A8S3W5Q3_PARAO|nr:unnamed protein product [Parnassius apollo]
MALFLKFLFTSWVWLCYKEVYSAPRIARLSLAEPFSRYYFNRVQGYPGAYTFGYDISDPGTGNMQYRNEERYPNGTVVGSYGYLDPFGSTRRYQYVADEKGYRVINDGLEPFDKIQKINVQKAIIKCYPADMRNMPKPIDLNDEKCYPNGTVVGKYNYVDKEGNPVHVKYYADDTSYGVELKSMKVLNANIEQNSVHSEKQANIDNVFQTLDSSSNSLPDIYNSVSYPTTTNKYKYPNLQFGDLNKDNHNKENHKTSPDYEIYLQNELQAPKGKCAKDKVRIYIDKGKRKIREVLNDIATFKYSEQF